MAHIEKFKTGKGGNFYAIFADHIDRRIEKERGHEPHLTNEDIKHELTPQNYSLLNDDGRTTYERYNIRMQELEQSRQAHELRALRADAVKAAGIVVYLPEDKQNNGPQYEKAFFTGCLEYAKAQFGEKNIIGAEIHKDENRPHIHLVVIPTTPDHEHGIDRVNYKKCFTREDYAQMHPQLEKYTREATRDPTIKLYDPLKEKYKTLTKEAYRVKDQTVKLKELQKELKQAERQIEKQQQEIASQKLILKQQEQRQKEQEKQLKEQERKIKEQEKKLEEQKKELNRKEQELNKATKNINNARAAQGYYLANIIEYEKQLRPYDDHTNPAHDIAEYNRELVLKKATNQAPPPPEQYNPQRRPEEREKIKEYYKEAEHDRGHHREQEHEKQTPQR